MVSLWLLHVLVVVGCLFPGKTVAWVASPSAYRYRCRFIAGSENKSGPNHGSMKTNGKTSFSAPMHGARSEHHLLSRLASKIQSSNESNDDEPSMNNNTKQTAIATSVNGPDKKSKPRPHDSSSCSSLLPSFPFLPPLSSLSSLPSLLPPTPQQKKFANGVVLAMAFGYAIYTILSIDVGMSRGWSAPEIAMRIPLDNWGAYESTLADKPILTKSLINVVIYLLGDWLSQTAFKDKPLLDFELDRTLRNGLIGLCFGPLVHSYYEFSDWILPPENGLLTKLQKILMDQTIYLTVKCSMYIAAVGLLAGEDPESVKKTVTDRMGGVVATAWKFWPIVHCVTYSVIPAQHRVLWVNSVDLVWNAILSSAAQKVEEGGVAIEAGDKTENTIEGSGHEKIGTAVDNNIINKTNKKKNVVFVPPIVTATAAAPPPSFDAIFSTKDLLGGPTNTNATAVFVGA